MQPVIKFNTENFNAAVRRFPHLLYREEKKACQKAAIGIRSRVTKQQLSGPYPDKVQPRTGAMRKSINHAVFGEDIKTLGFMVFFNSSLAPYAPNHESPPMYSTVTPVRAKALAIPTKNALTPAGVVRGEYTAGKGRTLRSVPGLFFVRGKDNKWAGLAVKKGKGIKVIYIFKQSITYRRKLHFLDAFAQEVSDKGQAFKELETALNVAAKQFGEKGADIG